MQRRVWCFMQAHYCVFASSRVFECSLCTKGLPPFWCCSTYLFAYIYISGPFLLLEKLSTLAIFCGYVVFILCRSQCFPCESHFPIFLKCMFHCLCLGYKVSNSKPSSSIYLLFCTLPYLVSPKMKLAFETFFMILRVT